jgi:hypothetical protein
MGLKRVIKTILIEKLPRKCQLFIERIYLLYCVKDYVENLQPQ